MVCSKADHAEKQIFFLLQYNCMTFFRSCTVLIAQSAITGTHSHFCVENPQKSLFLCSQNCDKMEESKTTLGNQEEYVCNHFAAQTAAASAAIWQNAAAVKT